MSSEEGRTRPASPHRREEAIRKGQAPATPEVAPVMVLAAVAIMLIQLPRALPHAFSMTVGILWTPEAFRALSQGDIDPGAVLHAVRWPSGWMLPLLMPLAVTLVWMLQKGFRILPERMLPDPTRVMPRAPVEGLLDALQTSFRGLLRLGIGFFVGFRLTAMALPEGFLGRLSPGTVPDPSATAQRLVFEAMFLWVLIAVIDYLWRRWKFEQDLMMTPEEVKTETRSLEGDPRVKAEVRSRMEATLEAGRAAGRPESAPGAGAGGDSLSLPDRRVLIEDGDAVALVGLYRDTTRQPVVLLFGQARAASRLRAHAARLGVTTSALPGVTALAGCRPGAAVPPEFHRGLASIHTALFAEGPTSDEEPRTLRRQVSDRRLIERRTSGRTEGDRRRRPRRSAE